MIVKFERQELDRLFGMHIGCEVVADCNDEQRKGYLTGIHGEYGAEIQFIEDDGINVFEEPHYDEYRTIKMLLTPLSSITDEHAIEIAFKNNTLPENWQIFKVYSQAPETWCAVKYRRNYVENDLKLNEDGYEYKETYITFYQLYDWQFQYLIQKGYAVPLFFGAGHWANGKTAIELGIAIDKTKHP